MKPRPRVQRPPLFLLRCWWLSVAAGALVVGVMPRSSGADVGLTPATLPLHLRQAAPPDARDVRVNGVYGSGRSGAWQFIAHLTWRLPDGSIGGGLVSLPEGAGDPAALSPFAAQRLAAEERLGWPLSELAAATARLPDKAAWAAMLELAIPAAGESTVTFCAADRHALARCRSRYRHGPWRTHSRRLQVNQQGGALSVTAASHP